jgi:hypothetical protein
MERGWFGKAEVNWLGPGVVLVEWDMVVLVKTAERLVVDGIAGGLYLLD